MRFIGRRDELDTLDHLRKKRSASLAVVWGRRRIGKSRLIEQFLQGKKSWSFTGLPPTAHTTINSEIDTFVSQMSRNIGMPKLTTDDWAEVFWHLGNQATREPELIIFFDEISWMGSKDPNFLGHLKTEWDKSFSKHPKLIFILCGSISNWIEENILSSTGFLGRISTKLEVKELPLSDCNVFWGNQERRISAYEKLKLLSVTGGVPKYLEEIVSSESTEENIRRLCFRPDGLLFREYDQIFSDLFSRRAHTFDKIIRVLVNGAKTLDEFCNNLAISKSGNISSFIHELVLAGFIAEDPTWNIREGKISNLKTFRLRDNYIRFYIKCIEPNKPLIEKLNFPITTFPNWESLMALQFENLVINNLSKLCELLRIDPQDVARAGPFFQKKTKAQQGCQIDLLIQTRFRTLYLCEIKFSTSPVDKQVVTAVQEKIDRLARPKGYSIRTILIQVSGVTPPVIESAFFDYIIDFAELLKK